MAISLKSPVIVPAIDTKTFDEIWMKNLTIHANNPNKPVMVMATFDRGRTLQDGSKELQGENVRVHIEDFFAEAEKDPSLLVLMGEIITRLQGYANL